MTDSDQQQQTSAMWILLVFLVSLGALFLFDSGVWAYWRPITKQLYTLRSLPEHTIGDGYTGPARYVGTLETSQPREAPDGTPSVFYFAWVEDHYQSGRSSIVRTLCTVGEDEQLTFRQGSLRAPLELFTRDENIKLLKKDGWLEPFSMQVVGIDLGPLTTHTTLPDNIRQRCNHKLFPRGTMRYKQASITHLQPVVVVACQQDGALRSCPSDGPVPGIIAAKSLDRLMGAYAQRPMNWLRGPTLLLLILVSYLCSLLLRYSGGDS